MECKRVGNPELACEKDYDSRVELITCDGYAISGNESAPL